MNTPHTESSNSNPQPHADDPIQKCVKLQCKDIAKKVNSKLCLLHFYSAPSHMAGAIRRTSVSAASETTLHEKSALTKIDHETALNRYIRRLKRQNTFLNLVAQIFENQSTLQENPSTLQKLTFEIQIAVGESAAPITVTRSSLSQPSSLTYTIKLTPECNNSLLEKSIANQTIAHLYADREEYRQLEINGVLDQDVADADMCVARAFGAFSKKRIRDFFPPPTESKDALRSALTQQTNQSTQEENQPTQTRRELWRFLHILQSALLYARGASDSDNDTSNQGMVLCARRLEDASSNSQPGVRSHRPHPAGADAALPAPAARDGGGDGSTSIGVLILVPAKHELYDFCELRLQAQDLARTDQTLGVLPDDVGRDRGLNGSFWEKLKGKIKNKLFPFPRFYSRACLFTQWTLILLDRLRESVHEGEALEFWFVIGEKSEFDDHPAIDIIDINVGDDALNTDNIGPRFSDVKYEKRALEWATRQLEKEHFPWFALGRHALFWNVSGAGTQPLALVKLRGGNWSQTVTEANREQQRLEIPPCVVAYQGQKGNRGVLLVTPRTDAANGVALEHLVAWRGQRWQLANSGEGGGSFEKRVTNALCFLRRKNNSAGYIAELCCRLARDPDRGGCIVFVKKKETAKKFVRMGRSWRLGKDGSLDSDDVLALMSHDGATIVCREKFADDAVLLRAGGSGFDYHAVFRCLLPREAGQYEQLGQSVQDSEDFPLASAGSRRWSSAVTAFTPDVQAVLVVSQDGDLQVWRGGRKKKKRLNGATLMMISTGSGRERVFRCKKKNKRKKKNKGGEYRWVPARAVDGG